MNKKSIAIIMVLLMLVLYVAPVSAMDLGSVSLGYSGIKINTSDKGVDINIGDMVKVKTTGEGTEDDDTDVDINVGDMIKVKTTGEGTKGDDTKVDINVGDKIKVNTSDKGTKVNVGNTSVNVNENVNVQFLSTTPTSSTVLVNGEQKSFDAYKVGDSNYFKLRDLAYVVNGSPKQFGVSWSEANNAIELTAKSVYVVVGGELKVSTDKHTKATPTSSKIIINGKEVSMQVLKPFQNVRKLPNLTVMKLPSIM